MKFTTIPTFSLIFLAFACTESGNYSPVSQESPQKLATVTTNPVTSISTINAYTGGDISDDGGSAIKERGVCYSTKENPTVSDSRQIAVNGARIYFNYLSDLKPGTLYYLRAYATTSAGTAYGKTEIFKTLNENIDTGTVTDRNGFVYLTVKIGDQWWMAENLKTTRFRNEVNIVKAKNVEEWISLTTPGYCAPDFSTKMILTHEGYFYNQKAVTDIQNLAPEGWHLPTAEEWQKLIDVTGGANDAGLHLFYSMGYPLTWDIEGLNSSGFSARHSQFLNSGPYYKGDGLKSSYPSVEYWTSTQDEDGKNYLVGLSERLCSISTDNWDRSVGSRGYPVRFVKD